jgi:hypothetical protein
MAGEHLKRTHTSTGSKKKFTYSFWFKSNITFTSNSYFFGLGGDGSSYDDSRLYVSDGSSRALSYVASDVGISDVLTDDAIRDYGSWYHFMVVVDTTIDHATNRVKLYINGVRKDVSYTTTAAQNANISHNTAGEILLLGSYNGSSTFTAEGNYSDVFNVDGQALTPDVFGFYKDGNGYISAGTTQSTDFRPGQWVPHSPRRIKSEINRRGGFGVNGFYLPMNSSNNFGADFHCEPDTILKLKSSAPQPKAEIDGVGDYTGALRDDPLKDYLVLAIPGVSGGLQNGFGDYSAAIRGYGSAKNVTASGNAGVSATSSYYGSALSFDGSGDFLQTPDSTDFTMGAEDYTIEGWFYFNNLSATQRLFGQRASDASQLQLLAETNASGVINYYFAIGNTSYQVQGNTLSTSQWTHIAIVRSGDIHTLYTNGVAVGLRTQSGSLDDRAQPFSIGRQGNYTSDTFNGYIQDLRVYKGAAKYKGGFDVPKPYTPVGIGTWRAVPDTTANNFATLNAVQINRPTSFSDGNLSWSATTAYTYGQGNVAVPKTGKWVFEGRFNNNTTTNNYNSIGVGINTTPVASPFNSTGNYGINDASATFGQSFVQNGVRQGSITLGAGDIIQVLIDRDNNQMNFVKNGTLQTGTGSTVTIPSDVDLYTMIGEWNVSGQINFGQNPTFSGRMSNNTRINSSNSSWDQTPNTGTHNDWTISNDGRDLNVAVSSGSYARAYIYLDPNEKYLLSFDYVSGPSSLGVQTDTFGYLTAVDGSVSPNGLSSGNSYTFEISNSNNLTITGFNSQTYNIDNIYLTRVVPGYSDSNGKGEFRYEPPSGFLALCEDNLPAPTIKDPGEHFKTVLYSGDNSAGRRINVGFQPDFIWFKSRNAATSPVLVDSVRGFGHLNSDGTNTESTSGTLYVGGYADNGFDLNDGSLSGGNTTGRDYVAWCWKAGGEAVTNTDGSITSQVSANQDAGFSIATYTATGSTGSIGHGLGKTPAFVITKHRNLDTHWRIWHKGLSGYNYTLFFTTGAEQVQPAYSALPTDSVINLSGDLTGSYNFVTYCWAEVEGFSKFGSYVGNANADGPFVYCGFKPALVMIKRTDSANNWIVMDTSRGPVNPTQFNLLWNATNVDYASSFIDCLSNGFKVRTTDGGLNASGGTYIFAAFAESPFQTANAK